ncbi:MAG: hypothetical protein KBG28_20920 [Kofleriaceae bacterium]|jgi:hypothetical protein|nr:hypothetical protein [Kofleriaceae bacterium]
MKLLALSSALALSLLACGKSAAPTAATTTPAATTPEAADPNDPDQHGIGAAEAAAMACYEDCIETGPGGKAPPDWASLTTEQRSEQCEPACAEASKDLPADSGR